LEVADGLWQFEIPMRFSPLGCTFSYLLADAATLIDAGVGTDEASSALEAELKKVGLNVSDLERVILTHLHRDHMGLMEYITSVSDVQVCAHETAPKVLKGRVRRSHEEVREEINLLGGNGFFKFRDFIPRPIRRSINLKIDRTLADGDILELEGASLRVIWTPGHALEHICLYDADRRVLLSGDHILPRITPHISLHVNDEADPLRDYLTSLEKLKGLPVDLVLPAHEHVLRGLDERIEELKRHHEFRCGEIKDTLKEGELTVLKISSRISWDSRPWPLMSSWTRYMAAEETLAHLVYLRNRGEIKERLSNGTLLYSLQK